MSRHFVTKQGITVPAITTDQMREVDRVAVEETGPNLFQMMENAGRSMAEVALRSLRGGTRHSTVIVLAGTGGNGGGGICAARHIANRGFDVRVVLTDPARLDEVPRAQLDVFSSSPGAVIESAELDCVDPALVIDAVIGYSIHGAPRGRALDLIEWCADTPAPVLSLDIPSGVDATSGMAPGAFVRADRTMTLALPKTGLLGITGELLLADLGIPNGVYGRVGIEVPEELFFDEFIVSIEPMT